MMLEIKVKEIRGKCPVYKVGDRITIDDPGKPYTEGGTVIFECRKVNN